MDATKYVRIIVTRWKSVDYLCNGAAHEDQWEEIDECESGATWGDSPVAMAVDLLDCGGFREYSSSHYQAHDSAWYSAESYQHPHNGSVEERSAHLYGFSEAERREIWQKVIGE